VSTVLIGVGNRARGDDGAGREVARRLRDRVGPEVRVLESTGDPAELLATWNGAGTVVVVDAVSSGSPAGTLIRCEVGREQVPRGFSGRSTHELGLAAAIELARELDALPQTLVLFGIEGARFDPGDGLSPAVEREMERITDLILKDLSPD